MINDYLTYIALVITIIVIPGPAVILTIKNSVTYGYKVAIVNIIGNFIAMVLLASLSALGLGTIILTSTVLFTTLKIAGCLYLVYMGIKMWGSAPLSESMISKNKSTKKHKDVFQEGFRVGISNPKAIAFFTALFPQFIDPTRAYIPQFLTLIVTIEGISIVVLTSYALISSAVAPYLSSKKPMVLFNKLTGAAFIVFGFILILEN